jgi:competence protein ComEC
LFIASILAFCAGIYVQSVWPLSPGLLLVASLPPILAAALLGSRFCKVSSLLILSAFILVGAMRLAFTQAGWVLPPEGREPTVLSGTVVESSPQMKVLSLSQPSELKGMRVTFLSGLDLQVSDSVRLFGVIKDLNPTFRNPGMRSWKWLKKMEGINYEVRGTILSTASARDWIGRMRAYFKKNIEGSGAAHTDILTALTIGDRAAIPADTNELFMRTGTSHVLAISGFNVGIISGFFFFLVRTAIRRVKRFRLSGRDSRYASLLVMPFPFVFMLVAGAGVSVIRATIMTIVFMAALFLERERHFYNITALAALAILLIYPHSLLTPSFQLTFMSLLFIVMFMERLFPVLAGIKNRIATWSVSTVLSTAAATLGTAPIVVYYFYGMNPFCVIHNLITIPLLGVGATASALIGMVLPGGHRLLVAAGYLTDINIRVLKLLDFGYVFPMVRPTFNEMLLYYGLITTLLHAGKKPAAALLVLVFVPLAAAQTYVDYRQRFNEDLHIHFIDVGMGDAALLEIPGGIRVLLDGGGFPGSDFDVGKKVIAPFLLYRKVGHLDYVINTHPHADHLGGLPTILRDFTVSHLVTSGLFPQEPAFLRLIDTARAKGVEHLIWKEGDGLRSGRFSLRVLYPPIGARWDDLNNASLVLRLQQGNRTFLLPGDIRGDVEENLVLSGLPLRSDVLKLAHHGSALSNGPAFVYAVNPSLAIVSGDGEKRGLPSAATIARLDKLHIPLLRTDKHGLIEVWSDGNRIGWRTHERE